MTETSTSSLNEEDRISELPNDILIPIISRLSLREATATCILSTSWRHLYGYVTHLNIEKHRDRIHRQPHYLSMVNQVLNTHRAIHIKVLAVDMSSLGGNFEKWFEFALSKKAETIHISMFHDGLQFLRCPNMNSGFECIKDLSLSHIRMTDQDFELLVSICLSLECLTIRYTSRLQNITIVGLPKLNHLNLTFLLGIESIVIRDAISLVSLTFYHLSWRCGVQLSNTPKLTKLDCKEAFCMLTHVEILTGISSCIRDQLQLLHLSTKAESIFQSKDKLLLAELGHLNVKHLELMIDTSPDRDSSFFHYVRRLVEACVSLEKLVIKFQKKPQFYDKDKVTYDQPTRDLSLKYVEITGYWGCVLEVELTLYIINNARAPENITLVPHDEEALARAQHNFGHVKSVSFLAI